MNELPGVPTMIPRHGKAEVGKFFEVAGAMDIVDLQILSMMEGGNQPPTSRRRDGL